MHRNRKYFQFNNAHDCILYRGLSGIHGFILVFLNADLYYFFIETSSLMNAVYFISGTVLRIIKLNLCPVPVRFRYVSG